MIPDPIRDIERAIDPLYDFRKYGIDLGLNLSEGKKKRKRESPEYRDDRLYAWEKVQTWKEIDFKRQYRVSRSLFNKIVSRIIDIYPGNSPTGKDNYDIALRKGENATPWGPIIVEVKVLVFLRLLAGASAYDMYWYGVNVDNVRLLFPFVPGPCCANMRTSTRKRGGGIQAETQEGPGTAQQGPGKLPGSRAVEAVCRRRKGGRRANEEPGSRTTGYRLL